MTLRSALTHSIRPALVAAALCGPIAMPAQAQDYPTKPIHLYMGYPAGTYLDIVTRHFSDRLQKMIGQTVVVENKVGMGGIMAMADTLRQPADGYTIHFGPGASAAVVQFKTLPFEPSKDFIPVAAVVAFPFVLIVNPKVTPVNSVPELVEFLKKKDKVSYGSPNTLSLTGGALFSDANNLKAEPVQYKSAADGIRDLLSGDLDFTFNDAGFAYAMMREGKLRGLAVTLEQRSSNAPDLPTMTELGYKNFDFHGWMGTYVSSNTPKPIVEKLEKWFLDIAKSDETAAFYKKIGADPFFLGTQDFIKWEAKETDAWKYRAKIANIQPN